MVDWQKSGGPGIFNMSSSMIYGCPGKTKEKRRWLMGPGKSRELHGQLHRTISKSELLTSSFDQSLIVCVLGDHDSTRSISFP